MRRKDWVYGKQVVHPRKLRSHWLPGIAEIQLGVRKIKWYEKYEWMVDCNIPRKDHPLSGRHPVAYGRTWTRRAAYKAAEAVVWTTDCRPAAVRDKKED